MRNKASTFYSSVFTMAFLIAIVMGSESGLAKKSIAHAEPIFEREIVPRKSHERVEFQQGTQITTPLQARNRFMSRSPALQTKDK